MGAFPIPRITVEEYFALDDEAELPSEYHDGQMFEMEAATQSHGLIGANVVGTLFQCLRGTSCRVLNPVRVRISPTKFVIPDLTVVCGKTITTDQRGEAIVNPKVIVEILSPKTEGYDYHRKFDMYRQLPTFEEYILIAQDQPRIEIFRKALDSSWNLSTYEGAGAVARVQSLELALPLDEIYSGVDFV